MINELKFDAPTSKKMEELTKMADEIISRKSDNDTQYILSSDEHHKELNKKENRAILNKMIDRKISYFLKTHGNYTEGQMKEVTDVYDSVSKSIHNEIDKLETNRSKFAHSYIVGLLKKYKYQKDEKVFLFSPVLDQPIETEYDINLYISRDIFSNQEKNEFASTLFEFDKEISKKYYELAKYYQDNTDIGYYEDLLSTKKEINDKRILFTGKYMKILETGKMKIEKTNYFSLYKDDIILYLLEQKNIEKFNTFKEKYIKNYFRKDRYNKGYVYYKWIVIEEFYKDYDNKEYLLKKYRDAFKNDNALKYIVTKSDIIVREEYRKDIDMIKMIFIEFLKQNKLEIVIDNAYISDYEYIDDEKDKDGYEKINRLIKIKD